MRPLLSLHDSKRRFYLSASGCMNSDPSGIHWNRGILHLRNLKTISGISDLRFFIQQLHIIVIYSFCSLILERMALHIHTISLLMYKRCHSRLVFQRVSIRFILLLTNPSWSNQIGIRNCTIDFLVLFFLMLHRPSKVERSFVFALVSLIVSWIVIAHFLFAFYRFVITGSKKFCSSTRS